jgi:hypothetical protein
MIGYYVHHQGFGHLARAMSIGERLSRPVTVLTSRAVPDPNPFTAVVTLPRDDSAAEFGQPTAHGSLHWAPHLDAGYGGRMAAIAEWVRAARPEVFVVDVSVEVATLVRLLGIPVVVTALPGNRIDAPHRSVHRMADQIIAAWPRALRVPTWLQTYEHKTAYVGGISRFDGRPRTRLVAEKGSETTVVVLSGVDGLEHGDVDLGNLGAGVSWSALGASAGSWTADPWPQLSGADVVVTHAGQNSIADVAAAARPTIVIPQARPYDEQHTTAEVLRRHRLAAVVSRWPQQNAWPELLDRARSLDTERWRLWEVDGAARRAAAAIEDTAQRCRGRTAS